MANTPNPNDPVVPSQSTAERWQRATLRVEDSITTNKTGDRSNQILPKTQFWARITGSQLSNSSPSIWKYGYQEVIRTEFSWIDMPGGRTGDEGRTAGETGSSPENIGLSGTTAANWCSWAMHIDNLDTPLPTGTIVRVQVDYQWVPAVGDGSVNQAGVIPRFTCWADTTVRKIGIVQCCGSCEGPGSAGCDADVTTKCCPDGCESFPDNRYWVVRAYIANDATDDCDVAGTVTAYATNSPAYEMVVVENLAEAVDGTHYLRPGTPVEYWSLPGQQTPPQNYYVMEHTPDPTTGGNPCSTDSCYFRYKCTYHCSTMVVDSLLGPSDSSDVNCGLPSGSTGAWELLDNEDENQCVECTSDYTCALQIWVPGTANCCANGDCSIGDSPADPDLPTPDVAAALCGCSSNPCGTTVINICCTNGSDAAPSTNCTGCNFGSYEGDSTTFGVSNQASVGLNIMTPGRVVFSDCFSSDDAPGLYQYWRMYQYSCDGRLLYVGPETLVPVASGTNCT